MGLILKDPNLEDHEAVRILRSSMTWSEWFRQDLLRYWYIIVAFALDGFILYELQRIFHVSDALGMLGLVMVLILLATGEVYLYSKIWPRGVFSGRKDE